MPGLRLLHDRRGAGTLQMLVLAVGLALAGMGAAKALSSAAGKRSDCAGQEIQAMAPQPCNSGSAGSPGEAAPAPPPPAPKPQPQPEAFDPQKELLNLLADILGITDAKKCFTEGDILACVMTFVSFSPFKIFGTAVKIIKNIPRIKRAIELVAAARKAKKIEDDARRAEKVAREAREAAEAGKKCTGGKCDKPGVCFAAGTPVQTDSGPVSIEDLQPGDLVWSRDGQSGEEGYRPIERTFVTPDQELLALSLEDASGAIETLEVTAPHPFRVDGRGWVAAGELEPGDQVIAADGGRLSVAGAEETGRTSTVYNVEVEDFHTYFVGQSGAWVHNRCGDAEPLPGVDGTGKVHGKLPRPSDLSKYSREELEVFRDNLKKSVKERIRKTDELGRDRAHGQRQAEEQQLIKSIDKFLEDHP